MDIKRLGDGMADGMANSWSGDPNLYKLVAYALATASTMLLLRKRIPWNKIRGAITDDNISEAMVQVWVNEHVCTGE